jgi:acyl-homoserine-lactone acylase
MLLANPHLPWGDLYTFFEAHLMAPGFNAYGASLVGFPVLNIAFNQHLGWTHTVNVIDVADRYELSIKGTGYELDGGVIPFVRRVATIKVRQPDGHFTEQQFDFMYSRHGPIVALNGNKAYAIRIAGFNNPNLFLQWHLMAKANNWEEFDHALRLMQLPMFNVVYADQGGNILYLFDGNVPRRAEGDWEFWHGMIDGRYSRYIWDRVLSYDSLPKLFDPQTGFVQNANDPPWNCTYPALLKPSKFPPYLSSQEEMPWRPQRAINMIRNDNAISFEKLMECEQNTGMEVADRFLKDLLAAAGEYPDSIVNEAAEVLRKWDRMTNADSKGAILFTAWFDKVQGDLFLKGWDRAEPVSTPAGLKDYKKAAALLRAAAVETISQYGSLDVAWGDVYRFRSGGIDYPANGGDGKYGIFRAFYFQKDKDSRYRAIGGDSYVAVTEFGKNVRAKVLLSYGNSSQAGSLHRGDQLLLLSQDKLRQAWLTKTEILLNTEEKEVLKISYEGEEIK